MSSHNSVGHKGSARKRTRGFTLIEVVISLGVAMILASIAVPRIQNSVHVFGLKSAVTSVTQAIQSTRYQAIFHGCSYRIAFNAASNNYQVSSVAAAAGATTCSAAYANVGGAIPLAGSNVALNANVTLQFNAGGSVSSVVGSQNAIVLTYTGLPAETIQVSNYGTITVTP